VLDAGTTGLSIACRNGELASITSHASDVHFAPLPGWSRTRSRGTPHHDGSSRSLAPRAMIGMSPSGRAPRGGPEVQGAAGHGPVASHAGDAPLRSPRHGSFLTGAGRPRPAGDSRSHPPGAAPGLLLPGPATSAGAARSAHSRQRPAGRPRARPPLRTSAPLSPDDGPPSPAMWPGRPGARWPEIMPRRQRERPPRLPAVRGCPADEKRRDPAGTRCRAAGWRCGPA